MKKIALILACILLISALSFASAAEETVTFTDSTGRAVEVPAKISKVAVTGPMAQIVLFALCPDMLVGVSNAWDETAKKYFDQKYLDLPVLGQLYGGKGEMNKESLLASGAEVVIDVGEAKGSIVEDLNGLTEQTGLPFIHVDAALATMGDCYRMLGKLLGLEAEAETLAAYCERVYADTNAIAQKVNKVSVLYLLGDDGLNAIAKNSYHAEVLDMLTNNAAVVDEPSSKGTGNKVDFEQLLIWNPEVILFAPGSIYATVGEDAAWQSLTAIAEGKYYEVPFGPYNWMGFPPSVQRLLGMQWLTKLLYPEETASVDLSAAVKKYYSLFYHATLTDEQVTELIGNAMPKAA